MNIYLVSILFCLFFLGVVIELIRRKKLEERYSILWIVIGFVMLVLSIFPNFLEVVSEMLNVIYAPSLLFFIGYVFALVFILHLTTVVSKLHRQITRLIQEVALLQNKLAQAPANSHSGIDSSHDEMK